MLAAIVAAFPIFAIVAGVLAAVAYRELARLYRGRPVAPSPVVGTFLTAVLVLAHLVVPVWSDFPIHTTAALAVLLAATLALAYAAARLVPAARAAMASLAFTYLAAVYVGWLFGFLIDLHIAGSAFSPRPPQLHAWLLLALLPTWAADVAAYGVGSTMGRRKLAPRISPGKTWEGTIGGFAAAAIVAFAFGTWAGLPPASVLLVAAGIGPAGLAGDLIESALKRGVGAKDSGALLPGHGGVFDRIDSLVTVAPLVFVALRLADGGVLESIFSGMMGG